MFNDLFPAEKSSEKLVFLGGTCADSKWRDYVMPKLTINYFNPVVEDWTPECQEEELRQRVSADYILYVITPKATGAYSVAELIDDSNKRPERTLFCILYTDDDSAYTESQGKSMNSVARMASGNGATQFSSLDEIIEYLNNGSI